jgi:hypothetical protein
MTLEELATDSVLPTEGNVHDSENALSRTDDSAAETIRDSGSREDGEIRSENRSGGEEDLSNVDVDINELVAAKAKSYPPTFVFGKFKVTAETIKEYEKARFFPIGDGHPPSKDKTPPEADEIVVFRDFTGTS